MRPALPCNCPCCPHRPRLPLAAAAAIRKKDVLLATIDLRTSFIALPSDDATVAFLLGLHAGAVCSFPGIRTPASPASGHRVRTVLHPSPLRHTRQTANEAKRLQGDRPETPSPTQTPQKSASTGVCCHFANFAPSRLPSPPARDISMSLRSAIFSRLLVQPELVFPLRFSYRILSWPRKERPLLPSHHKKHKPVFSV